MKGPSILVVEDDSSCREFLALVLRQADFDVRTGTNGVEALIAIEDRIPDLVITDLQMAPMDGLELLRHMKPRWQEVPVILLTVANRIPLVVEAIRLGAVNYMVKPASPTTILQAVRQALVATEKSPHRSEVPSEILGISAAIVEVRHLVVLAARSHVNVMITGPTGAGKELVARSVHRLSSPCLRPWVAHNCAATPPDLFESEFFGHRRGAFTGAERDHVGLLERASGGTLFLDELESFSLANQAKLLRVMDDGEFRSVGSSDARRVVLRFLAATNREPNELLGTGTLRDDLFYRLRGFEIRVPPLRERREDIQILARHLVEDDGVSFSTDALGALESHTWPGNVRELRNVMRVARDLAGGAPIEPCHLGPEFVRISRGRSSVSVPDVRGGVVATRGQDTLRDVEREAIRRALKDHGGNRCRVARALGIDRSTLRRKMRDLDIVDQGH